MLSFRLFAALSPFLPLLPLPEPLPEAIFDVSLMKESFDNGVVYRNRSCFRKEVEVEVEAKVKASVVMSLLFTFGA
jgi:hypothetical protein